MFAVHRKNLHAIFFRRPHHERAARHKRLFIGERQILSGPYRREGRLKSDTAHHGIDHYTSARLLFRRL